MRVCLVSPGHLVSDPRLLKEADTLAEAGHIVHVIYGRTRKEAAEHDNSVLMQANWTSQCVSIFATRARSLSLRLLHRVAFQLFRMGWRNPVIAAHASHPLYPDLRNALLHHKADLFIGHCIPALPMVVEAAQRHGASCGFDAEDFHSGESINEGDGAVRNAIARTLESRYLSKCDYLTAASPLIANRYRECYGVNPVTILNVFPLAQAIIPMPAPEIPAFYWFSQTIGPGRGLEAFIELVTKLPMQVRLDLRGYVNKRYQASLQSIVRNSQVEVKFLPPEEPQRMISLAGSYTAGLALETGFSVNNNIALSNKIFTYLLAGLPVIMTPTSAQSQLADDLGKAAMLLDLENQNDSLVKLKDWILNPKKMKQAREAASRHGRERFCWDTEKQKFLTTYELSGKVTG